MRIAPALLLAACTTGPSDAPLPGPGGAAPLAHLAGCWRGLDAAGDRWIVSYSRPMDGIVHGTSRQVHEGRLVTDELERFSVEEDGTLIVTPIANGIPRDSFAFDPAGSTPGDARFLRRGEGFPQVLRYRRATGGLEISASDEARSLTMELRPGACP